MKPKHLLLISLLVPSGGHIIAQVSATAKPAALAKAASDPLTGLWSGYIGQSEASPSAAKFEIRLAPGGTISGNVTGPHLDPGDITGGSFDAKTGALKLTVTLHSASSGDGGSVTLEGRVVQDSATGKILLNGRVGFFKLKREAGGGQISANVTSAAKPDAATTAARRSFVEVADWITRAADLVPAEKYSYRPAATVRTFGQLVGHVADGLHYYCGRAGGKNVQWADATEKGVTTKAALVQALKQAVTQCNALYEGGREIGPLIENVGHSSLHYGNMVTYIRMLGLTPPSS